jgi:signal transduction histidine kinase
VEPPQVETPEESLDRLRFEIEELRASRERLVVGDDADRRSLERDLHDGPQQHLIALAVNLQLARRLADSDTTAAKALLDEMGRDVQEALDETGRLAHRIYPPLLDAGGLAAALRAAALITSVPTRIDVSADGRYPAAVAGAVYFCCLEVLEGAGEGARATVSVREEDDSLVLDIVTAAGEVVGRSVDRLEALGGALTVRPEPGGGLRVSGVVPVAR